MRIFAVLTIFALAFSAVSEARAAGEDVFVVARVPVQASADSATAAKNAAQAEGRRRAMDILLRRLTPEEDWIYLPRLALGEPAPAAGPVPELGPDGTPVIDPLAAASAVAPPPQSLPAQGRRVISISPARLVELEQSFEVYGEKSSSRLYRAFITYRFKPDAVRRLLKEASLPYSESQTRTALVLPVLQTDRDAYLWERNNPWMAAWRARPFTHELTPMIAPLGDLEDATTIDAETALALGDEAAEPLAVMADRYGVSQVIVAHARLKQIDGEDQVSVRLINAYRQTADAAAAPAGEETALDDTTWRGALQTGDAYNYQPPDDEDFAAEVGEVIATAYLAEPSGNFPLVAERLIEAALAKYSSGWKEKTLIDHSTDAVLAATAFFDSLEHWARIRGALVGTPLVGSVRVGALSPTGAEMEIRVFGDPERLRVALENQGIVFWTETGGRWFMATPDVSSRYRGKRFLREAARRPLGAADPDAGAGVRAVREASGRREVERSGESVAAR